MIDKTLYPGATLRAILVSGATLIAIPPKMTGGSGFTLRVLVDTDSTFAYKQSGKITSGAAQTVKIYGILSFVCLLLLVI